MQLLRSILNPTIWCIVMTTSLFVNFCCIPCSLHAVVVQLGCEFVDGDNWHPTANVEKMSRGIPLTDEVYLCIGSIDG